MTLTMIKICKPSNSFHTNKLSAGFIYAAACSIQVVIVRDIKFAVATVNALPHPHLVLHEKREDFLIRDGIHVSDDEKLLTVLHQLRHVFAEEREGWVGHHDVCLLEQADALLRAEVTVSVQRVDAYFCGVGNVVAVPVAVVDQINGLLAGVLAEEVHVLILVARGDEAAKAQKLEVVGKIGEEVGDARVVAVAEHGLAAEMLAIVAQLVVYVLQLRVELVLLSLLRSVEIAVWHVVFSFGAAYLRRGRAWQSKQRSMDDSHPYFKALALPAIPDKSRPCQKTQAPATYSSV